MQTSNAETTEYKIKANPSNPLIIPKTRTIRNRAKRPGRNELCPCGSGKKAKRCCVLKHMQNEQAKVTEVMDTLRDRAARMGINNKF